MNKVFLCLGGNLGPREALLHQARERIVSSCGSVVAASQIFETEGWETKSENLYLNQVIEICTNYDAVTLLDKLMKVEAALGRERGKVKNADRHMDIDILFFNDQIIDNDRLVIPHPRLHLRRFVLVPLNQIAPLMIHPVFNTKISDLLSGCKDPLRVNLYQGT